MRTIFMIIRDGDEWALRRDIHTGVAIADAADRFRRSSSREAIHGTNGVMGFVIGGDTTDTPAIYVVRENEGEKVTSRSGSRASIEALVNVLRGHGYTCIKRSSVKGGT